jgi:hypothetical protein
MMISKTGAERNMCVKYGETGQLEAPRSAVVLQAATSEGNEMRDTVPGSQAYSGSMKRR